MKCLLLNFLIIFLIIVTTSASYGEEDYYWQEYTGDIPKDAFPGGKNKEGKMTYIGQVLYEDTILIPGDIDAERKTLTYAMNAEQHTAIRNVKIFCVRNSQNYEWINTNVTHLRFLTQRHLISGGYDDGYPLLIGRAEYGGRVVVGKVTINKDYEAFAFATDEKAEYVKSNYQVLVYNSKLPQKVISKTVHTECGDKIYNIHFY